MKSLLDTIKSHRAGTAVGLYSVCSSHPLVIEATMRHAMNKNEIIVIEATSNQVNQDGGYTGLKPQDFCTLINDMAAKVKLPRENIILGGDHLGPNCWQHLPASIAMEKSAVLIKDYVQAGFRKIHLDCSMSCADDPVPLGDFEVAKRAAQLCEVAESAYRNSRGEAPIYIIGTEVPVPGGAHDDLSELDLTSAEDAQATLDIHQEAFRSRGLDNAWERVIGLVVQPGVEFDHHKIVSFQPEKALELSQLINANPNIVYEAHSTDYQSAQHLKDLVNGHFAILKVGPWLTFAMREALWALDAIEHEWIEQKSRAHLKSTTLKYMESNPEHWQKYYTNTQNLNIDCQYSLSDRIRYYWPVPEIEKALNTLISNLDNNPPPLTLISQYLPIQYKAIINRQLKINTRELIFHKISEVLKQYSAACYQYKTSH